MRALTPPVSEARQRLRLPCLRSDERGVSAVEFALILPFMLTIYLGAFQLSQGLAAYRKMTITTRTVVDLATQYPQMSSNDVSNVLNASAQVMTPFNTANMSIVLTEFTTTASLVTTVTWSRALNGTAMNPGTIVVLPSGLAQAGTSILLSQVTFKYAPPVLYKMTGTFTMSDKLYMTPRQVQTINLTN